MEGTVGGVRLCPQNGGKAGGGDQAPRKEQAVPQPTGQGARAPATREPEGNWGLRGKRARCPAVTAVGSAQGGESAAGADSQASVGSVLVPWVEAGRAGPGGELVEGLPLGTSVVYTCPAGRVDFCGLRNSRGTWRRLLEETG